MKVCIYFEGIDNIKKSGVGRAFKHQVAMCQQSGIEYTTNYLDDYDILHINTVFLKSNKVIKHARSKGAKVIYHAHTTKEDFEDSFKLSNYFSPFLKKWLVHLYSKADLILTPTEYSKHLLQSYGIRVPVFAISNGIDMDLYEKDEAKEAKFMDFFDLEEEDKVFFSVGLWFKRKGIFDFIKLAGEMPEYKFIWFGQINKSSIPNSVSLAIKNAPSNCIFPGYIDGDIIKGAFTKASGFLFMSFEETEGIVVLEALASKQVVILRDILVYKGWLHDGVDCLKAKSIAGFKDKIKYVVNNDTSSIREKGYEVACSRDIKHVSKEMAALYNLVLTL